MLVGIKSEYHVITDQVPVIFSSPVRGTYYNESLVLVMVLHANILLATIQLETLARFFILLLCIQTAKLKPRQF